MARTSLQAVSLCISLLALVACSVDSAKSRYILAEKLWTDGKYNAAVHEFEKVVAKDPRGKLGLQAQFRSAMTQTLYLSQHREAIKKFQAYVEAIGDNPAAWEAQKQIGEILFAKLEQYDQAIRHYRELLRLKPTAAEGPEFQFRIGKAHFFLWQFDEALQMYKELTERHGNTPWGERAAYEIGVTFFTRGEQQPGEKDPAAQPYQQAIGAFQRFMKNYPRSALIPEAKFGVANALEELDQLDAAYQQYEALQSTYPSPNVVQIKLARIRERKAQRSR